MKLETRMRQSIKRRTGTLILRSDVASLGSPTQVTHALDVLIQKGELIRLTRGLYAKTDLSNIEPSPIGSITTIIREAANKLGLIIHSDLSKGISCDNEKGEILVETENPRIERRMFVNGKIVHFRSYNKRATDYNKLAYKGIPTSGVAKHVSSLAKKHNITYSVNPMDTWAQTVTRLAGDVVKPDHVEDLIIALKRAGKISKKEVATLTVNYLRETKRSVRSV